MEPATLLLRSKGASKRTVTLRRSGWIKTEDRLPEKGVDVLVYIPTNAYINSTVDMAELIEIEYSGNVLTWLRADGHNYCDVEKNEVTHWMPLPEPPKVRSLEKNLPHKGK